MRKVSRTTSPATATRRRACGSGQVPPSSAATSRRCCRGSTGPMARSAARQRPEPRRPFPYLGQFSMTKVLIADALSPRAVEIFGKRGIETDVKVGLKPDALKEIIAGYDGLAVRSATKVTRPLIERAEKLKVIGRAGIGIDNIDLPAATQRGIVVMNTPYGNSITTAEHAIALMFALGREAPTPNHSTQAGNCEKSR